MSKEMRQMINKVKFFKQSLNEDEDVLSGFKYDAVKNQLQKAINNNSLSLDEIKPDKYFIVCFGLFNQYISSVRITDKTEALNLISHYKKNDNIWKIYVEKPSVGAVVFIRKEWGWEKK